MAEPINSTLDDIAAVIGFTAAVRLAAHYGDRDVFVPENVSELHPIAKLIGISRSRALHANWQGERISVPSLSIVESEIRRGKILALLLQGINCYTIAKVMSISERRIQQLKKEFDLTGEIVSEMPGRNSSGKLLPKIEDEIDTEN